MLETLREYALERLEQSGEGDLARAGHAAYFAALGERAEEEFEGSENAGWLERLRAELDDLRAALSWSLGQDRQTLEAAIRLAAGRWMVWGSPTRSGLRDWLERAIGRARQLDSSQVGVGLYGLASLALRQSDLLETRARLEEALPLLHGEGSGHAHAEALTYYGYVLFLLGERERAFRVSEEALAAARRLGGEALIATATSVLGSHSAHAGDHARARALYAETVALRRRLGAVLRLVNALSNLGCVAMLEDDYEQASAALEEALALARERELPDSVLLIEGNLALVALFSEEYTLAETRLRKSVTLAQEVGGKLALIEALRAYAALEVARGHHERAGSLWGAADGLADLAGGDPSPAVSKLRERFLEPALRDAGSAQFEAARSEGRKMTFEEALEYALRPAQ
ncbi:MAG: tetratricopeptide repeat protein [Actinobacteria bacterium]|nr:tetratricopeptide repeat protein [Actinomycetota bacterium]